MSVYFFPCKIEEHLGLDLCVTDPEATVLDLIEAIQPWCDNQEIYKTYLPEQKGTCKGCVANCCNECFVLPDAISYQGLRQYLDLTAEGFNQEYFDPIYLSRGLPRLRSSPCIFLHQGICSVYPYRTLICRLYICTPMTAVAQTLVYGVTAAGIGEFIRIAEAEGLTQLWGKQECARGSYERMLWDLVQQEAQRKDNPFRDRSAYDQVYLRSFCTEQEWKYLTQNG